MKNYSEQLNYREYSLLGKMLLRLRIIVLEGPRMNFRALLFALRPASKRRGEELVNFLQREKAIRVDDHEKSLRFGNLEIFFGTVETTSAVHDLISIYGRDFSFFRRNFVNSRAYIFEGPYENDDVQIHSGDVVIDAGASLGIFSLLASEKVGARGKIFAFEPVGESLSLLEKNLSVNGSTNVSVMPYGLGQRTETRKFAYQENLTANSGCFLEGDKFIEVKIVSIDELVREGKISKVDFIKADIEGMEREMLIGARETIARFKPRLAICAYHREDDFEVLSSLIKEINPEYRLYKTRTKILAC